MLGYNQIVVVPFAVFVINNGLFQGNLSNDGTENIVNI
jgi:hypothetical protein